MGIMMISSSAKQGRWLARSLGGVSRCGHISAAFRAGKKCKFSASPPSLLILQKNLASLFRFRPTFLPSHPLKSEVRREETEWADKSKQNSLKTHIIYMKHTHTATPVRLSTFLSCGTLPFNFFRL